MINRLTGTGGSAGRAAAWRLTAIAAATLALGACTPQVVKESAPAISKTIGKLEQPSVDVLPIIRSEPIAADPGKALGLAGDATANQFLVNALAELRPDDGLLSEESADTAARLAALKARGEKRRAECGRPTRSTSGAWPPSSRDGG